MCDEKTTYVISFHLRLCRHQISNQFKTHQQQKARSINHDPCLFHYNISQVNRAPLNLIDLYFFLLNKIIHLMNVWC